VSERSSLLQARLSVVPMTLAEANDYVIRNHRHHGKVVGHLFSIGLAQGDKVVGVCIVGRPVARARDDGFTAEVTRLCTDGTPHACSKLYAAAWRAARAMGYRRIGTYILAAEPGTSLKAAGWEMIGATPGRSWDVPSRPRVDKHPLGQRTLWEVAA
jgi:hypothetical protein